MNAVKSLPDRITHTAIVCQRVENAQFPKEAGFPPGEFARDEVSALASATLNVPIERLLEVLRTPMANHQLAVTSEHDTDSFREVLDLVEPNLDSCARERLFIRLPLRIASHAVGEAIDGLRHQMTGTGLDANVFASYLLRQIVHDFVSITLSVYLARQHSKIQGAVHDATDKPRWTKSPAAGWSLWGL